MPIKFTDAKKWDDVWFSQLTMEQKVMFMYLCDMCNIAGFLEVNERLATLQTGVEDVRGTIESLSKSVLYKEGYVWIKKYLKHQKNLPINIKNKAHISIIKIMGDRLDKFPEIFEHIPVSDGEIIKAMLKGDGGGTTPLTPSGIGIGISNGISNNTVTTVTPQEESKIARLYKYFVGEDNLMGQGITGGMRKILAEAIQVMDAEEWRVYCEARLKDEFKAAPNKFFLEDGWRRYQDSAKEIVKENTHVEARREETKQRAEMPEQEAPDEFKEFVKDFGKRVTRDTETVPDTV